MLELLASPVGRWLRILFGIAIIAVGYFWVAAPWKYVLEGIGLIPVAAGVFDLVFLGPMMGGPIRGREIRGDMR